MTNINNNYCVIIAGGKGRRLWPCSREARPKQFIDFFGCGRTLLQQTFDRMRRMLPLDHIYINTNMAYLDLVHEQLPEVDDDHILAEPIHRNTAPSVAWACHRINHTNEDACLLAIPSDQMVLDEQQFFANVGEGFSYHQFVDADNEAEFDEFVKTCKDLAFYDTGITPKYGDKLICLSTCEYSQDNGRLVVAAVRIT